MVRLITPLDVTFDSTIIFLVYNKKCMLVTFFTHAFIYVKLDMSIQINIFHRNTIPQSRCTKTFSIKLKHTRISWSTVSLVESCIWVVLFLSVRLLLSSSLNPNSFDAIATLYLAIWLMLSTCPLDAQIHQIGLGKFLFNVWITSM